MAKGCEWPRGMHGWWGVHGWGRTWLGACMAGGGACVARGSGMRGQGGVHGLGACVAQMPYPYYWNAFLFSLQ